MKKEYFKITSVHREDLEELGFDAAQIDDLTMIRIARKMADIYVINCFWDDLAIVAGHLKLPKRTKGIRERS